MPKIPTFQAKGRITAEAGAVRTNIQVSPFQTTAGELSKVAKVAEDYYIKQRDNNDKIAAKKKYYEMKSESDKIIESQKNNGDEFESVSIYRQQFGDYRKQQLSEIKNNRVKKRLETLLDIEQPENIYKIKKNSFEAMERNSNQIYTQEQNVLSVEYTLEKNLNKKKQIQDKQINSALEYKDIHGMGDAWFNKEKNIIISNNIILDVTQEISSNPRQAYLNLQDKNKYIGLDALKRTQLINKVKITITPELKKEFNNVIFSLQDKGTEQPFDFNFAKQILKTQEYNELRTNYDLAKTNAEDVRLINTLPLSEVNNVLESKNFNTDLYVGSADRITQAKLQQGLVKAIANRTKQMKSDPVKFITETNPEISELTNDYQNETDESVKLKKRELLSNALIDVQTKMEVSPSNIKILTKAEVTSIKSTLTNPDTPWEEKQSFINSLPVIYGTDNMGKVLNHLQFEKLPNEYAVAMSTNNKDLSRDILIGSSTKDLEKVVAARLTGSMTPSLVLKYVGTAMKDSGYEDVIYNQGSGSVDKTVFIGSIQDTLYNATLERINKGVDPKEAAKSAVSDFISDYKIDPSLTYMIPTDINGKTINQGFVTVVNDNILLGIQDTSEGNYLDRFHGEDGYIHYAQFSNAEGVTEEMAKEKITSTIRNNAKWLLNADGTGAILYAEFSDGTYPITNAKGQKIETSFLNPTSTYPVTGDELPLIDYVDPYGAVEYEEVVND